MQNNNILIFARFILCFNRYFICNVVLPKYLICKEFKLFARVFASRTSRQMQNSRYIHTSKRMRRSNLYFSILPRDRAEIKVIGDGHQDVD